MARRRCCLATATRRNDELRPYRTPRAPIMPASSAAQNGWMNMFAVYCAKPRRRTAPAAALTKISNGGARCWTPKITESATAPAAAAVVKSHSGAGGAREIASIASAQADRRQPPRVTASWKRRAPCSPRQDRLPLGPSAWRLGPRIEVEVHPNGLQQWCANPRLSPSRRLSANIRSVDWPLT